MPPLSMKISRLPQGEFREKGFSAVKTPYFSLKAKRNATLQRRIGVVVSKTVDSRAVKRNFFKRQAKAQLSKIITPGSDLLAIFFPKAKELTKKQLQEELMKAARRIYS